jgi:hypothetical protein
LCRESPASGPGRRCLSPRPSPKRWRRSPLQLARCGRLISVDGGSGPVISGCRWAFPKSALDADRARPRHGLKLMRFAQCGILHRISMVAA